MAWVIDEFPARRRKSPSEFLGVDLVSGTAQRDDGDDLQLLHPDSLRTQRAEGGIPIWISNSTMMGTASVRSAFASDLI